jgi:hypothetical protein
MDNQTSELWKSVLDWPYEVSIFGQIRRTDNGSRSYSGNVIKGTLGGTKRNYPVVQLCRPGARKWVSKHKLVANAFLGPCPDGMEIHHKDHNPLNPRLDNLEYVTRSRNKILSVEANRWPLGERRWNAVLTEGIVKEIRMLFNAGWSINKIADRFAANFTTIYHVVRRNNWKHVD